MADDRIVDPATQQRWEAARVARREKEMIERNEPIKGSAGTRSTLAMERPGSYERTLSEK